MAAIICASGQRRFAELFLLELIKWAVKLVLKWVWSLWGNTCTMCEFHESTCNGFGGIWWTDNPRAQNTRRHAALCRAAAVTCREALKMCGRCAARLAAMPWLSKYFEICHVKLTTNHNVYFHFYMRDAFCASKVRVQIIDFPIVWIDR